MAKAILYKSKKLSNDEHPVVIRWYENGKQKVFTVGSCTEKQWNADKGQVKKSHPFADQINEKIKEHLGNAILDGGIKRKEQPSVLIIDFIESEGLKSEALGKLAQKDKYKQLSDDLLLWNKRVKGRGFDSFTKHDIENFYIFLMSETKGNSKNTASRKMSRLSTVFRNARRAKVTQNDPFLDLSFQRTTVMKRKLTRDEMTLIENADLSGSSKNMQLARDSFVMQFYLRGLRIGDVLSLKPENIDDNRIVFEEGKGGSLRSIPLRKEVTAIIDKWKGESGYLLPILKYTYDKSKTKTQNQLIFKKSIEAATTIVNGNLKKVAKFVEIEKNITTHIARHTFAKIAIDTVKNIRISQELIGHKSLRVHQDYIKDLQNTDELDQAADDVFGE